MRLVILGGPGAGKGTQAMNLSAVHNVPHISTGDIFRSNINKDTNLGRKAREFIDKGLLVPDDVTIPIVKERLLEPDCQNGFILDGFPRTIEQAEKLDAILEDMEVKLDKVLNIYVPDDVIVKRMSGRRICPKCRVNFHTKYKPTVEEGICDNCKSKLVQRKDDKEEIVKQRLETYHIQTKPLIEYYSKKGNLVTVRGKEKIEDTTNEVIKALGEF